MLNEQLQSTLTAGLSIDDGQLVFNKDVIESTYIEIAVELAETAYLDDLEEITTDTEKKLVKAAIKDIKSIVDRLQKIKKSILSSISTTIDDTFDSFSQTAIDRKKWLSSLLSEYEDKMGIGQAKRAETLAAKKEEKKQQEEAEQAMILTFKCPNEDAKSKLIAVAKLLGCEQL